MKERKEKIQEKQKEKPTIAQPNTLRAQYEISKVCIISISKSFKKSIKEHDVTIDILHNSQNT